GCLRVRSRERIRRLFSSPQVTPSTTFENNSRTPSLFSFGDQPRSLIGPRAFRGRGLGVLLARRRSLLPHRSSLVRASGSRGPTASADRILKANHGSIRDSALSRPDACSGSAR